MIEFNMLVYYKIRINSKPYNDVNVSVFCKNMHSTHFFCNVAILIPHMNHGRKYSVEIVWISHITHEKREFCSNCLNILDIIFIWHLRNPVKVWYIVYGKLCENRGTPTFYNEINIAAGMLWRGNHTVSIQQFLYNSLAERQRTSSEQTSMWIHWWRIRMHRFRGYEVYILHYFFRTASCWKQLLLDWNADLQLFFEK